MKIGGQEINVKGVAIDIGDKINGHTITKIEIHKTPYKHIVLCTDDYITHKPEGDFGASWFENVSFTIT